MAREYVTEVYATSAKAKAIAYLSTEISFRCDKKNRSDGKPEVSTAPTAPHWVKVKNPKAPAVKKRKKIGAAGCPFAV
jgi:hypothetical protein